MLYTFNNHIFKLQETNNQVKLYYKAVNKWSSGWAYVGCFNTREKAESAARQYAN